ncbi:MAG: 4-hydroxy-tetrahydrodipicolinate synthase [Rhodospirillaceae bacterium]|jgi:4-hydroxy-tetrahydrodipicolinate synthase|nr:4-hydroxy-tetrahydrodipicolinate synthase [Rhodospirillaceae bacterium]MBT5457953.1 4-hydroxy-tetrahydrodipicolinate synthase [Rhodospirillaceae bacterium]
MLHGSICALVTPFKDGAVDAACYESFVDWQIEQGTEGLVPCGTTGESPTLSHEEHMQVVEICVGVAKGRVPVIAGTGSNSTDEAIMLTKHAKEAGADAALVVTPYYNKPTQEGLYQHYKAINDAVDLPIIIYNIPARSIVDMSVETMTRLAKLPNIVGVKDATNDVGRATRQKLAMGSDFTQLSGEDGTQIGFLAQGGIGCISVTANIAPKQMSDFHKAWRAGNVEEAQALNERLMPLHVGLFCESSPGPVKYGASLLDKCSAETRLPLCEISESSKKTVEEVMRSAGLLN